MRGTEQTDSVWAARGPSSLDLPRAEKQSTKTRRQQARRTNWNAREKPGRPAKAVDKSALIAYRLEGHSTRACAQEFGVSTKWLSVNAPGLPKVKTIPVPRKLKCADLDIAALIAARDTGMSYEKLGEHFGVPASIVRLRLKGHPKPARAPRMKRRATKDEDVAGRYYVRLSEAMRSFIASKGGAVWVRDLVAAEMRDDSCYFDQCGERDRAGMEARR